MTKRSVVFWNVERLFETTSNPIRAALSDEESDQWTTEDLSAKLTRICATLKRIADISGPLFLVGLCEVASTRLAATIASGLSDGVASVDSEAEDASMFALDGINIALLYDKTMFDKAWLRSHILDKTFDSRDILEVRLRRSGRFSEISIFVNHWPSRLASEGAAKRVSAAYYLRNMVQDCVRFTLAEMMNSSGKISVPRNSEVEERANTPVFVLGDFNDQPFDRSIEILHTTVDPEAVVNDIRRLGRARAERYRKYKASVPVLLNPFWRYTPGISGSYYRSPAWRTYDQVMCSRGVVNGRGRILYTEDSAYVFDESQIKLPDGSEFSLTNSRGKPLSFVSGSKPGCSDHFPVVIQVETDDD